MPRYWATEHPRYEVDYIIQCENDIIPVEVKSGVSTGSIGLKKYKEKYGDKIKLRVRFSLRNLKMDDDMLGIPLFLADRADRLISLALK